MAAVGVEDILSLKCFCSKEILLGCLRGFVDSRGGRFRESEEALLLNPGSLGGPGQECNHGCFFDKLRH